MMHSQMTYPELVSFIEKRLSEQGSQAMLTAKELRHYRKSIQQDPLLETLLIWYLPYQKRWERAVWRSVQAHRFFQQQVAGVGGVHDPALSGPRIIAKNWIKEAYPHEISESEEKWRQAKDILTEIADHIASGKYDSILVAQERHRQIELEEECARNEGRKFNKNKVKPGESIESIKEKFKDYIEHFKRQIEGQTASVDEILCLKRWVDAAPGDESTEDIPLKNKDDRMSIFVECLDESRTAYFAGGSFQGQEYSCPIGAEERFLDRIALIMSAEKGGVAQTPEQIIIEKLIGPFIQKDTKNQNLIPTDTLYQHYLAAIGATVTRIKQGHFSLKYDSESQEYARALQHYVENEKSTISLAFESYQNLLNRRNQAEKNLLRQINQYRSIVAPYLKKQSDSEYLNNAHEQLLSGEELTGVLEQNFHSKIAQLVVTPYFDDEDLTRLIDEKMAQGSQSLPSDDELALWLNDAFQHDIEQLNAVPPIKTHRHAQLFYPELFEITVKNLKTIQKDDDFGAPSANASVTERPSDREIIEKMAERIGFGPEHIELLLSIIGQSRLVQDQTSCQSLGGLELLQAHYDDGVGSLEESTNDLAQKQKDQWSQQEWLQDISNSYLAYIEEFPTTYLTKHPFITMLPNNFNDQTTLDDIQNRFAFGKNWPCSAAIMNRLLEEGRISFNINAEPHSDKALIDKTKAFFYEVVERGHLELLKKIHAKSPSFILSTFSEAGESVLHTAIRAGHLPVLRWLFEDLRPENAPSIGQQLLSHNTGNEQSYSPLIYALKYGNQEIFQYVLKKYKEKKNSKINITPSASSDRAIFEAIGRSNKAMGELIAQALQEGYLVLSPMAYNNDRLYENHKILSFIRTHAQSVIKKQKDLFDSVATRGYCDMMQILLQEDFENKDKTIDKCLDLPLDNPDMVLLLLKAGGTIPPYRGSQFLALAVQHDHLALAQHLLADDPSLLHKFSTFYLLIGNASQTAAQKIENIVAECSPELVELLFKNGLLYERNCDSKRFSGQKPPKEKELISAIQGNDFKKIFQVFLNMRAAVTPKTLAAAVTSGNPLVVQLLLPHVSPRDHLNLIRTVIKKNQFDMLRVLLQNHYLVKQEMSPGEGKMRYDNLQGFLGYAQDVKSDDVAAYLSSEAQKISKKLAFDEVVKMLEHPDCDFMFEQWKKKYHDLPLKEIINQLEKGGDTLLMRAVRKQNHHLVKKLLDNGANPLSQIPSSSYTHQGATALHFAVNQQDVKALDNFLSAVPKEIKHELLDMQDGNGWTALMYAIENRDISSVEVLLAAGASITPQVTIVNSWTYKNELKDALRIAVNNGDLNIVTMLVDHPQAQEVLKKPGEEKTVLDLAVERGSIEIMKILRQKGASVSDAQFLQLIGFLNDIGELATRLAEKNYSPDELTEFINTPLVDGTTLLMLAVQNKSHELVKFLIASGADITVSTPENNTRVGPGTDALKIAANQGDLESVRDILSALKPHQKEQVLNSQDRRYGSSALILAVRMNDQMMVEELIKHGARVDIAEHDDLGFDTYKETPKTAMQLAADKGNVNLMRALLKGRFVERALNDRTGGSSALDFAINNGHREMAQLLKESGAQYSRNRVEHQAAYFGDFQELEELGRRYVDNPSRFSQRINQLECGGYTCLMLAAQAGSRECVTKLLELGADISIQTKRGNAINEAFFYNPFEAKKNDHLTVFHLLTEQNNIAMIKLILQHTPQDKKQPILDAQDSSGRTALFLAIEKGYPEIVQELLNQGASLSSPVALSDPLDPFDPRAQEGENTTQADAYNALEIALVQNNRVIIDMVLQSKAADDVLKDPTNYERALELVQHDPELTQKIAEKHATLRENALPSLYSVKKPPQSTEEKPRAL